MAVAAGGYSILAFVDDVADELQRAGVPAIWIGNTQFMDEGKTPAQKLSAWLRQRDTNPTPAELALSFPNSAQTPGQRKLRGMVESAQEEQFAKRGEAATDADCEVWHRIKARRPKHQLPSAAVAALL